MLQKKVLVISILIILYQGCSRSTDELIQDLYSDSSVTRRKAATMLTKRRGDREAVQKLIKLLDEDNELITLIVTQILGALSDSTAVVPLGKMVEHPNYHIRTNALWSLGSLGHDSALPYIVKGLKDPVSHVRYAAVVALGHLYYLPAVKYIYPMLRDEADSVRVRAIQSLYYYRSVKGSKIMAADFAVPLNDNSDLVRYVAVQALGGAWEKAEGWVYPDSTVAGNLLIEALRDKNRSVRIEAINSLRKIRFKKAVPVLKEMYNTASVDEEFAITQAIKEITGEDFPPPITNIQSHKSKV